MINILSKLNKKIYFVIIALILIIFICIVSFIGITSRINENSKMAQLTEFEYKTHSVSGNKGTALITIRNEKGIEKVNYIDIDTNTDVEVFANNRTIVGFDYKMLDRKHYEIKATLKNGETKIYEIDYEIPRIKGEYVLIDGMYVNKPDITTGFVKEKTRYLYLDNNEKLVPGNWLTDEEPANWFNYKKKNWANIYVESDGTGSYYVWIPRYCYKIDESSSVDGNERMDIKFINTYNEYIDGENGKMTKWEQLEAQGYKIPEAFGWDDAHAVGFPTIIPGYWMSKYQLSDIENEYIIDYLMTAGQNKINVKNIITNTSKEIAKCTYALNGKIQHESQTIDNYSFNNLSEGKNVVNVTLLDQNNSIIGSMTKEIIPVTVNEPDLSKGFNKEETYYVYYDGNDNEIIGNKISEQPPANWYNYTYSQWANIVITDGTVENGKITGETYKNYFVWIPRYAYMLDVTSEKSNVLFLEGTSSDIPEGYKIPEAFKWGDNLEYDLTGYWISKYQLTEPEE